MVLFFVFLGSIEKLNMVKEFNVMGICYFVMYYMVDISVKFGYILEMVEKGWYFIINWLWQYGKIIMLVILNDVFLNSSVYFFIRMNFQGIDSKWYEIDVVFV